MDGVQPRHTKVVRFVNLIMTMAAIVTSLSHGCPRAIYCHCMVAVHVSVVSTVSLTSTAVSVVRSTVTNPAMSRICNMYMYS